MTQFKKGDKLICKSSVFITSGFWFLKDRIYTLKDMEDDWMKFEEFRDNIKVSQVRLNCFYSPKEIRRLKLMELMDIEENKKVENKNVSD